MTIIRTPSGYICYTRLSNGILAKRVYQGYTKKEAVANFKAYLKTLYYTNYDIIKFAEKTGILSETATEKQQEKIIANWFNWVAWKFMQLHAKENKKASK